jgi:hypothetical protein
MSRTKRACACGYAIISPLITCVVIVALAMRNSHAPRSYAPGDRFTIRLEQMSSRKLFGVRRDQYALPFPRPKHLYGYNGGFWDMFMSAYLTQNSVFTDAFWFDAAEPYFAGQNYSATNVPCVALGNRTGYAYSEAQLLAFHEVIRYEYRVHPVIDRLAGVGPYGGESTFWYGYRIGHIVDADEARVYLYNHVDIKVKLDHHNRVLRVEFYPRHTSSTGQLCGPSSREANRVGEEVVWTYQTFVEHLEKDLYEDRYDFYENMTNIDWKSSLKWMILNGIVFLACIIVGIVFICRIHKHRYKPFKMLGLNTTYFMTGNSDEDGWETAFEARVNASDEDEDEGGSFLGTQALRSKKKKKKRVRVHEDVDVEMEVLEVQPVREKDEEEEEEEGRQERGTRKRRNGGGGDGKFLGYRVERPRSKNQRFWRRAAPAVFRGPRRAVTLFAALNGSGVNVFIVVVLALVVSLWCTYTWNNAWQSLVIVLLPSTGTIAGFIARKFTTQFRVKWPFVTALLTVCVLPIFLVIFFVIVTSVELVHRSSASVKAGIVLIGLCLIVWDFVNVYAGILLAKRYGKNRVYPYTSTVTTEPLLSRNSFDSDTDNGSNSGVVIEANDGGGIVDGIVNIHIPDRSFPWWKRVAAQLCAIVITCALTGCSAVYTAQNILHSIWAIRVYQLVFVLLAFILMWSTIVVCCAIISTYLMIKCGIYNWYWRTFFTSGSSSLVIAAYGIYYIWANAQLMSSASIVLASFLLGVVCVAVQIIYGAVGTCATYLFIRYDMYRDIRID